MLSKYTYLSNAQFLIVVLGGKYTTSVITDGWQVVVSPYPGGVHTEMIPVYILHLALSTGEV